MAAGPWTLVDSARTNLLNGTFDIDSDDWKIALLTSSSNISTSATTFAGVTGEVSSGNGYTSGGESVQLTLTGTTSVKVAFDENPTWTATDSGITARYAVLYKDGGNVLCYCLLDSTPADVVVTAGNTLTIDADGSSANDYVLQLS